MQQLDLRLEPRCPHCARMQQLNDQLARLADVWRLQLIAHGIQPDVELRDMSLFPLKKPVVSAA